MWQVERLSRRKVTLDFSSSEQANRRVTQVAFDGHWFANAVELTNWDANEFQVTVCEACGFEHCQSGGWVRARAVGNYYAFVPCFDDLRSEDPRDRVEYGPPEILRQSGIPLLDDKLFTALRNLAPELPNTPPALSCAELIDLLSFEAPEGIQVTSAQSLRSDIVAVSEGSVRDQLARLEALVLALADNNEQPLTAVPMSPADTVVTFYLDRPGSPTWAPLAITPDGRPSLASGCLRFEIATNRE